MSSAAVLPHPAVCRQISSKMVNTKENTIWEYFEESKTDTKYANCRNCKKKLAKGSELTTKLTTPNLKLHLKTIHPALHSQLVKKEMSKTVMEKKKENIKILGVLLKSLRNPRDSRKMRESKTGSKHDMHYQHEHRKQFKDD